MTELLTSLLVAGLAYGLGWWAGRAGARQQASGIPAAPAPAPSRAPIASRTWESHFGPDGTVILYLRMSLADEVQTATGTVGVTIPPGEVAKDVKARLIQRQADLVDNCLGWGMRVPEMAAAAPGKPRRQEVAS